MAERRRTGISIMGLDTAAPDYSVEDGKCGELYNLRFSGDAWRNVHPFVTKYRLKDTKGYKILYHHPSTGDNLYIAERTSTDEHFVSLIKIEDNEISLVQDIYSIDEDTEVAVSHFGNVLIINNVLDKQSLYYAFNGEKYIHYDLSSIWCKSTFSKSRAIISPDLTVEFFDTTDNFDAQLLYGISGKGIAAYEKLCNKEKSEWYYRDYVEGNVDAWRGEFAIFFALRDERGEVLYRSAPQIVNSAQLNTYRTNPPTVESISTVNPANDGNFYAYAAWKTDIPESSFTEDVLRLTYSTEYQKFINVDCDIDYQIGDGGFIVDVAIYATRLHSFFAKNNDSFANDEDLMQEPFYLMDVININSLNSSGHLTYSIGYDQLKNIEQKTLFQPKLVSSSMYADMMVEYNNRLHLISPTTKAPSISEGNIQESTTGAYYAILKWQKNNLMHNIISEPIQEKFAIRQWKLVSFPTAISTLYLVADAEYDNSYSVLGKLDLKYAAHIDYSYYIQYSGKAFFKYDYVDTSTNVSEDYLSDVVLSDSVYESNRIQVSESNNCFIYPYENSYRIGSNTSQIITANSAAIEMSDAKFGEFPLYVFTDEGVFAMQSGSGSVLYSAIVPISYDKAIQPNTLAVNYNVLFVTARGIMALSSQGVNLISESLNNPDGTIPEWLKTTEFTHIARYNEVLATDIDRGLAYVYSLDNRVWSKRDLAYDTKLNNGEVVHGNYIINLNEEIITETRASVEILTRPIKLGSMELKRLETFVLRFESASTQTINIQLSGSVDTVNWINFREVSVFTNRDIIIRRVPMSAKYLRVQVSGTVSADVKIIAMEMEFYLRMLHRMR
ncbi:MAG: hypothetical protein IIW50_04555 [Alistipes sp.]|nr:hypothetical protein [Alistipes sp.]